MAEQKFSGAGESGHYHQREIDADAAARAKAEAVARTMSAIEASDPHQAAINEDRARREAEAAAQAMPSSSDTVEQAPEAGVVNDAQERIAQHRARIKEIEALLNNPEKYKSREQKVALEQELLETEDKLRQAERDAKATNQESAEVDPVAAFYERLAGVKSFDELYGVLSRQEYVFETPEGEERWTAAEMIAFIRTVEQGERPLSDIPDAWGEIKTTVARLLEASKEKEEEKKRPTPPPLPPRPVPPPLPPQGATPPPLPSSPTPPPLPETNTVTPPPLPDVEKKGPPPLPETEKKGPPPLPKVTTEIVKGSETLLQELQNARDAYIAQHRAYLDERKAGGLLNKIKNTFTGVKPEFEDQLPESLRLAKDVYDDAMRAYGLDMAKQKLRDSGEAITPQQEAMAKANAFRNVFLKEYQITRRAQAETYPPAEKNLFVKGVEWWSKRSLLTKIGVTSGLVLFGGTIGAGVAAGLSGAGFAAAAGGVFEKVSKVEKLDQMRDQDLDTVWSNLVKRQPETEDAFSKAENEARKVMSADEARRRMRELKRTAVMLAAGVLGVVTMKGIMSALTGGVESAASGSAPEAPTPEAVPTDTGATPPAPETAPDSTGSGLRAVPVEFLNASPQETTWFDMLHHTPYDGASPLDQAKMTVIQKLSEAGIMGSNAGTPVPSPLVDRVIQSVFGGANSVEGWQAAANMVSDSQILEQIKAAQAEVMVDPSKTAVAEATIRALFTSR